uniref:LRRNT domain-containing protein n=1 Tax=Macrostomum lignano TaxID=282301 RepID=A0A1I8FJQ6_9PLAT
NLKQLESECADVAFDFVQVVFRDALLLIGSLPGCQDLTISNEKSVNFCLPECFATCCADVLLEQEHSLSFSQYSAYRKVFGLGTMLNGNWQGAALFEVADPQLAAGELPTLCPIASAGAGAGETLLDREVSDGPDIRVTSPCLSNEERVYFPDEVSRLPELAKPIKSRDGPMPSWAEVRISISDCLYSSPTDLIARMRISVWIECSPGFYGRGCDVRCEPQRGCCCDSEGLLRCDETI